MLLIIALIVSCMLVACKPKEPNPPADDGSQGDVPIPFRLSNPIRGADKTDVEFWEDGLTQYFDSITAWSKNESGTIAFNVNLDVNSTEYLVDAIFSYTTANSNKSFNALLSITQGTKTYNVIVKDNAIYYMLNGYNAVESGVEALAHITQSLPLGKGSLLGLGTILRGIQAEETVYYAKSTVGGQTKVEYLSQVKFKETLDAVDRHLSAEGKALALDFINSNFSTALTSLSKDTTQIDEQFPVIDLKMGYIGTTTQGSSVANNPEEVYFTLSAPASTKPAFGGSAQSVTAVFKIKDKTLQYTQTWQDILPIDTSGFTQHTQQSMLASVSDTKVTSTVTLLKNILTLIGK